MSALPFTMSSNLLTNDFFSLQIKPKNSNTRIAMKLHMQDFTTKSFPRTLEILKKNLPSIFYSKCYNPNNFPFIKEATETEIAHLFEHILLENMSNESLSLYKSRLIFKGTTYWNWHKEEKGTFWIDLNIGSKDINIFINALEKSILLVKEIIESEQIKKTANASYLFNGS